MRRVHHYDPSSRSTGAVDAVGQGLYITSTSLLIQVDLWYKFGVLEIQCDVNIVMCGYFT